MTDGADLLRTILATPEDDNARLVYADWLQENGEEERAEFIRVQVEIARMEDAGEDSVSDDGHTCCDDPCPVCTAIERYQALVSRAMQLLGTQVPHPQGGHSSLELVMRGTVRLVNMPGLQNYEFRRGFIERIICTAADWLEHAGAILAEHPVRRVKLTTAPATTQHIAPQPSSIPYRVLGEEWTAGKRPLMFTQDEYLRDELQRKWDGIEFEIPALNWWTSGGFDMQLTEDEAADLEAMGIHPSPSTDAVELPTDEAILSAAMEMQARAVGNAVQQRAIQRALDALMKDDESE